jgi:hypothetical protein
MGHHLSDSMKKGLFIFSVLSCSCTTPVSFMKQLEGTWCGPSSGEGEICETWKPTEQGWEGMGEWLESGQRATTEHLSIMETDSGWYYVAHPIQAKNPTFFKLKEVTKTTLMVSNPRHDFPQTILYRLSGDTLFVHLEGEDMNEEPIEEDYYLLKSH